MRKLTNKKIAIIDLINFIIFLYILSLYLLTYRVGLNLISNGLAIITVLLIWINSIALSKKIIFNKFLLLHGLFIFTGVISILYAINQNIAQTKVFTLIQIYLVMISLINYIDTHDKVIKIINYITFSGVIASIYILLNADFSQVTRYGELLGNQNDIGMIIGLSLTFSFYSYLINENNKNLLFLLIMLTTVLLTGSRKSLIFVFMNVFIITYLINRNSIKNKIKFIFILLVFSVILYYTIFKIPIFYQIIGKRLENTFDFLSRTGTTEGSINYREMMINHGIQFFKEKPILGYGMDNFRVLFGHLKGRVSYAHNNYIELLVDLGMFGTSIYYFNHLIIVISLLKGLKKDKSKLIYIPFLAILVSYFFAGISLVYYDSKLISLLISVASILTTIETPKKKLKPS